MRIASTLIFVLVGIATLNILLLAFDGSYLQSTVQRSMARQPRPIGYTSALIGLLRGSLIISAAIGIGLYVWFGIKVRQGRNWARIVMTVLLGLTLLSFLISLIQLFGQMAAPPYSYALNLVAAVLAAVILVLVWRPPAAGWFPARTAWARQQRERAGR